MDIKTDLKNYQQNIMKNKNNTPIRKRLNKNQRIFRASDWLQTYNGKNIVKGYSNWFGVDLICAISELKLVGIKISDEYESKLRQSIENLRKNKKKKKIEDSELLDSRENEFEFIAGYTTNGVPYGLAKKETSHNEK